MLSKRFFGDLGENIAKRYLTKKGYKILTSNFLSKHGEIDIIALKADVLCFIEVKARWSNKFGTPEEAVTPLKLSRIKKAVAYFCITHKGLPQKKLIQVVAIEMEKPDIIRKIKLIDVED